MSKIPFLFTTFSLLFFISKSHAGTNEASFTPTSILVPIRAVVLENRSETGETISDVNIYECDDDDFDENQCLVELEDSTAENYVGSIINGESSFSVDNGSYNRIDVQYCNSEGYSAQVKGSVTLGDTTYYTSSSDVLTTDQASMDYVSLEFNGCRSYNIIPTSDGTNTLSIEDGDVITFSMLVENTNIAWARLGAKTIESGCTENDAQDKSVCLSYPHPVPLLGTVNEPVKKIWHVDETLESGDAGGQVLLVFTEEDGDLIGGFTRRYFSETSEEPSANYDTQLKTTFTCEDSGICEIENYGSSETSGGYLLFSEFNTTGDAASFSSSFTSPSSDNDTAYSFTATLQE